MGVFPKWLKYAIVILLHKEGDVSNIANYRPLSLLRVLSNVFAKAMYYRFITAYRLTVYWLLNKMDSGIVFQLNRKLSHLQITH
jgi:hypothetical protein